MRYQITRWLEFDAGHRVQRHNGKCRMLHGHRYKVGVVLAANAIDDVGVVEDFGNLKRDFGGWIDEHFDHGFIFEEGDPWGRAIARQEVFYDQKLYFLPYAATAEGIARHLYETWIQREQRIVKVVVYETPNCFAEFPT